VGHRRRPAFYDSQALARHLYDNRTTAFIRIVMDHGIYVSMMIFAAGFRHLVRRARPESDWLGLLALVSAAVWLAVTLAADGLMGGAVLATLQGTSDVSAALPLVFGTLLIYNGSIAFAITGLFMAAAGWATLDSGVLARWTGWIAWISAVLCALSIPAMFASPADASGFYNPGGWGPAIIANFPPLIWFLVVGVVLIRQSRSMNSSNSWVFPRLGGRPLPIDVASKKPARWPAFSALCLLCRRSEHNGLSISQGRSPVWKRA
jgi:hypothetical protein